MSPSVPVKASSARRVTRAALTLGLTALCLWYIVAKIDFAESWRVLSNSRLSLVALAFAIVVLALVPLSWRWQRLLEARGIHERVWWLLRAYFVSYTASQVLPTSLGGDATRIVETSRRHRGNGGAVAGSVLLERGLGGIATLLLGALGFVLAIGRYSIGPYVWLELVMAIGTVGLAVVLFSRHVRRLLARFAPKVERIRLLRPLRSAYLGLHAYRDDAPLVLAMLALTVAVQALRILAIWLCGEAVGVHLSPLPYFVMGPMFFLVMLAPFTINGFALREAFFVSFLGRLGVSADLAFATGFLYLLIALAQSLPGGLIWAGERIRPLVGSGAARESDEAGPQTGLHERAL
jgi:glycosyltransferase 2 family protein